MLNTQTLETESLTCIEPSTSSKRPKRFLFPELVEEENGPNIFTTKRFADDVLEIRNNFLEFKKTN